jgi:hypothetical protein
MNEPKDIFNSEWESDEPDYSSAWFQSSPSNWQTDNIQDGYQENPYQPNFLDTPYSESFANPDGQQPFSSGWEIE